VNIPLTVALLTYNRAGYLKEAIGSILNQTYRDFEFLILDNGSTDETPQIVLSLKDDRIRYVRNAPGLSASFNWASAIKIARGELIIIVSDDDLLEPQMLAEQMSMLAGNAGMTAVWVNTSIIDAHGTIIQQRFVPRENDEIYPLGEYISRYPSDLLWPHPSTIMFTRKFFQERLISKPYYDREASKKEVTWEGGDMLWAAMMNIKGSVGFISKPLYRCRQHSAQGLNSIDPATPVIKVYEILKSLSSKTPQYARDKNVFENYLTRYKAQREVIRISSPELPRATIARLKALFDKAAANIDPQDHAFYPLLPLALILAQHGYDVRRPLSARPVTSDGPRTTRALLAWAIQRNAGGNILASLPRNTRIAILGTVFIAALLIHEARELGLHVECCIDSNTTRQNHRLLGLPIHPPKWLQSHADEIDCIVFSSERDQEASLLAFIKNYAPSLNTISWKDLAENTDFG
jgi:hypothetical protein